MSIQGVPGGTLEFWNFENFCFSTFQKRDFHTFDNMTADSVSKFKKLGFRRIS